MEIASEHTALLTNFGLAIVEWWLTSALALQMIVEMLVLTKMLK
jgi:hypothetical protein